MTKQETNPKLGFDELSSAIRNIFSEEAIKAVEKLADARKEEIALNLLLGKPGYVEPNYHMRTVPNWEIICREFIEIYNSWQALLDLEVYISRFPFNKTSITKERYYMFIIEGYCFETYILKERLIKYIKKIPRLIKNNKEFKGKLREVEVVLVDFVEKCFKDLKKTRHDHTHKTRIQDDELNRLYIVSSMINYGDDKPFNLIISRLYKRDIRKKHKELKNIIIESNIGIKTILDYYCHKIYPLIIDQNTKHIRSEYS